MSSPGTWAAPGRLVSVTPTLGTKLPCPWQQFPFIAARGQSLQALPSRCLQPNQATKGHVLSIRPGPTH